MVSMLLLLLYIHPLLSVHLPQGSHSCEKNQRAIFIPLPGVPW
jgi:hypothetical protein